MNVSINKNALIVWSVLLMVLSSGHLYFTNLNITITLIMMVATLILFAYADGFGVTKQNFNILLALFGVIAINTIINISNGISTNDLILWVVRLTYLAYIQSHISLREFKNAYINIMVVEAIISLLCFALMNYVGLSTLPLEFTGRNNANGYYLTPYYTVGWSNYPIFDRNAGFFWEPGAHQIFLNIAIVFMVEQMLNEENSRKSNFAKISILILTVFSTQSSSGYICLAIVLVSTLFFRSKYNISNSVKVIAVIALIVFVVIENQFNIIGYKLNGGGSYTTRMDDTMTGFQIAGDSWLFGRGIVRESRSYSTSNGLASLLVSFGYPIVSAYLVAVFLGIRKLLNKQSIPAFFVFMFYIVALSSESIPTLTLFLSFLFVWQVDSVDESGVEIYEKNLYSN